MNWYKSESASMPLETDTESSKEYNYVRRDIVEVQREQNGESITMYEYEECKIPKESWGLYLDTVQQRADVDYIATMTDVEL